MRGYSKRIFTIGHSTHSIGEFIALLAAYEIKKLIDIRTIPGSRHCPQFNKEVLKLSLKKAGIGYRQMKELGGFRHASKDSLNTGWKNASFRGFADYMQTDEFQKGLAKLEKMAQNHPTVLMCAEAVPWRCHRNLISDALTLKKWKVFHIQGIKASRQHRKSPFLKVKRGMLLYPQRRKRKRVRTS